MSEKNISIIKSSFSIGDASLKLYGYCNQKTKGKILKIMEDNGCTESIFLNKNKNSKYDEIEKTCPICKKIFLTKVGSDTEKITCSIACSNSYKPKRKKLPIHILKKRKYIRNKNRRNPLIEYVCVICDAKFLRRTYKRVLTCSSECLSKRLSNKVNERVKDGTHVGWQTRPLESYPEKFFKKVLNNMGIAYEFNLPVTKSSLGVSKASYYFLDFYMEINNRKIDLEIDGKQHEYPDRKKSDTIRDILLIKNGYEVYRIKWKNLNSKNNKNYIKEEISKLKIFLNCPLV